MSREEVREWAVTLLGRDLSYARFQLVSQTKREIVFARTSRAWIVWLFTILLFPLGLIFFFAFKRTSNVTVLLEKAAQATNVTVSGAAKARVVEGIEYRLFNDFTHDDDDDDEAS
jgi:hypothetical protein